MAYIPQKAKRQYQRALWEKKKDGTKGRLVVHDCAKCKKTFDGTEPGAWFERADMEGIFVWVCEACCEKRHNELLEGKENEYVPNGSNARPGN